MANSTLRPGYVNSREAAKLLGMPYMAFSTEMLERIPYVVTGEKWQKGRLSKLRVYRVADVHAVPQAEVLAAIESWKVKVKVWSSQRGKKAVAE